MLPEEMGVRRKGVFALSGETESLLYNPGQYV